MYNPEDVISQTVVITGDSVQIRNEKLTALELRILVKIVTIC